MIGPSHADWGRTEDGSTPATRSVTLETARFAAWKKKRGEVAGTPFGSGKSPREYQTR